jgi:hypothetical protein
MKKQTFPDLSQNLVARIKRVDQLNKELVELEQERQRIEAKEKSVLIAKANLEKEGGEYVADPTLKTNENSGIQEGVSEFKNIGAYPMSEQEDKDARGKRQPFPTPTDYQLSLFYYDVTERFTNVVDVYGEIPKFVHNEPQRREKRSEKLESIQRYFTANGEKYSIVLHPAKVEVLDKRGQLKFTYEAFPGTREEIVEDAIMKIAIRKRNIFTLRDTIRVPVKLYEIEQELIACGHTLNWQEIKESLKILNGSRMVLQKGKRVTWSTSTFPDILFSSDTEGDEIGYVQLHPLVAEGIKAGLYLQIDYDLSMRLKGNYTRKIYKTLASKFKWAGKPASDPFRMGLSSFLDKHSFKVYARLSDNAKVFRSALDELKDEGLILSYEERQIKQARKVSDYEYFITATPKFAGMWRRSSGIRNEVGKNLKNVHT